MNHFHHYEDQAAFFATHNCQKLGDQ